MGLVVAATGLAIVRPKWTQLQPLVSSSSWPDLDSHLNLVEDPYLGLPLQQDKLSPEFAAGFGNQLQSHGLRLIGWTLVRQVHADNDASAAIRSQ